MTTTHLKRRAKKFASIAILIWLAVGIAWVIPGSGIPLLLMATVWLALYQIFKP